MISYLLIIHFINNGFVKSRWVKIFLILRKMMYPNFMIYSYMRFICLGVRLIQGKVTLKNHFILKNVFQSHEIITRHLRKKILKNIAFIEK